MAASLVKGDADCQETMNFWRDIRAMYDREYPEAALIAEWSFPSQAIAAGFHVDFMIHFNTPAYTTLFRNEANRDIFRGQPPMVMGTAILTARKGETSRSFSTSIWNISRQPVISAISPCPAVIMTLAVSRPAAQRRNSKSHLLF